MRQTEDDDVIRGVETGGEENTSGETGSGEEREEHAATEMKFKSSKEDTNGEEAADGVVEMERTGTGIEETEGVVNDAAEWTNDEDGTADVGETERLS